MWEQDGGYDWHRTVIKDDIQCDEYVIRIDGGWVIAWKFEDYPIRVGFSLYETAEKAKQFLEGL